MSILKQERDRIKQQILENPSIITWTSPVMLIDEMTGAEFPDPTGLLVEYKERVRLSHERSGVKSDEVTPAGLGTSYSLFLLMMHNTEVSKGIMITSKERKFTVGAIDPLEKDGGIIGYQAPLTEVF